jgi:molybdopterin-guanine dinucleotide biosynthesis protein A
MGREKALLDWKGRPLVALALEKLAAQADSVAVNANGDPLRFAALAVPVIADAPGAGAGPLAGIAAVLHHAAASSFASVLTVPSDAPFFPADLAGRLAAALDGATVAVVETCAGLEPLFALWRVEALPAVERSITTGRLAVRDAMTEAGRATVAFPDAAAFSNLNTPEDYARALASGAGP